MKKFKSLPRIIHFFGPDGAGKSTQVEILTNILCRRGIRARICWLRSPHTLAFLLWKFLVRIGFYRIVMNPFGPPGKLPAVDRNEVLRRFWSVIELLGVLPMILHSYYSLWRGRMLIAERYLLDTVTTVAYFLNDLNFLKSWTSRLLLRFIPQDTVFIFLDADYATIFQRRARLSKEPHSQSQRKGYGAIPRCPVEPRSFIDFQRKAYGALATSFNPLIIETSNNSIEETSIMILRYLGLD